MTGLLFGLLGADGGCNPSGGSESPANSGRTRSCYLRSSAGRKIPTQAEPSRSAGTLVSPSVGRLYHSLVPSSGGREDRHAGLLPTAGAREGS